MTGPEVSERRIALPAFCLTCGYGQVPGERFNNHDCDTFRALSAADRQANKAAHLTETRRRMAPK